MNRFILSALIVMGAIGCKKNADADPQTVRKPIAADSAPPVAVAAAPDTSHMAARNDSTATIASTGDVTGGYFPIGKLPGDFSEIDFLGLATIDENAKPAPLNGFLRPKKQSAKDYHLVAPKLDGNNLSFTTETIDGVSYSFAGNFSTMGNFPDNPPLGETPVLKGTLKKMKDGKQIAETAVSFSYSAGG